jgi:hypothetical protein
MLVRGQITKEEYLKYIGVYGKAVSVTMKTAEEIIAYLEAQLNEAIEYHDNAKGKDPAQALSYMLKAYTISELLDEIKG